MSKVRRILRTSGIILPLLAVTGAFLIAPPAVAGTSKQAGSPKQYIASISVVPAVTDVTITVTLTNTPGSAALGSAQITVPGDFSSLRDLTISASANKLWKLAKPVSLNTITITARSDSQKIGPGQFVRVQFTATPLNTGSAGTFVTAAKASTGFTGTSYFNNVGGDPSVTICNTGSCTTDFGNPSDPPRDLQTAEVSLDGGCSGTCIVTLSGTAGDFCSLTPSPPNTPCRTHAGPDIKISGYTGTVTEILSCNGLDCPEITGGGTFASTDLDFYPVWKDANDGTTTPGETTVSEIVNSCGFEVSMPCLVDSGTGRRTIGEGPNTYYQSTIKMNFPTDPKTLH